MAFRALLDYSNTRVVIGVDPAIGAEIAFPVLKSLLTFTNINGVIQYGVLQKLYLLTKIFREIVLQ